MKNRVPDDFWKVDRDLPKVDFKIEVTSMETPSFYKVATDAVVLAMRDTNLPVDCRPLYNTDKIQFTITDTRTWEEIGVIVVEKGQTSPYMVGWLGWQLHPASHLVTHISEMLKSRTDIRTRHKLINETVHIVQERILKIFFPEMYCSKWVSHEQWSKGIFDIHFLIKEKATDLGVGCLIIEPFDPPEKDEEIDVVYTHMYKWRSSGESACTPDLENSLRTSFGKRWARFRQQQVDKKS